MFLYFYYDRLSSPINLLFSAVCWGWCTLAFVSLRFVGVSLSLLVAGGGEIASSLLGAAIGCMLWLFAASQVCVRARL